MPETPLPTPRRDFLATTGLATAAVTLTGTARAQQASGGKLRVGIIGCGGRCSTVAKMVVKDGRFEIVALAD